MKSISSFVCLLALSAFGLVSCDRQEKPVDSEGKKVPITIALTDNPSAYDSVNLYLRGLQARIDGNWVDLDCPDTLINVLDLQNGFTVDVASGNVPAGELNAVKFILDPEMNYVVINNVRHRLKFPGADHPGFSIAVNQSLNTTGNLFRFDFLVDQSIIQHNSYWLLEPVIKYVP